MERKTPYYSIRTGKNTLAGTIDLRSLLSMFQNLYKYFDDEGYFQKALGYHCVDSNFVAGELGQDLKGVILLELRKSNLVPVHSQVHSYSEDDLFDMIEFLHDHCAKPIERHYHSYSNCGWHCSSFAIEEGKIEFRSKINKLLVAYSVGYELSSDGEVLVLIQSGMEGLFETPVPTVNPDKIDSKIELAKRKFRRHKSSLEDRRDAIRELADVFEYLRPQVKEVLLSKDEADLFNIANNFAIRHHNEKQKTEYDKPIWYSWMFYFYLATIHACVRLIEKHKQ